MSEQQNLEIVRRGYEAFGRGDIETLLSLLDENIEWRTPGPPDLPTAGVRRGRQEVGAFFAVLNQTFDIQRFEPQTFLTGGDRVVVLGTDTALVKATGKLLVDEPWAHVFTVKDGRIVGFQEYLDTGTFVTEFRAAQMRA
ncbi:MAG TPA: nuclear transport factor 2 family protein [Vicinamibacterales bacterium]|nr:nuclear transport factor 2 family protein [Vicinamibacterales bacterium]